MKGLTKKKDIWPHWMSAYARSKNEFPEDEKYHNLMRWLIWATPRENVSSGIFHQVRFKPAFSTTEAI